MKPFQNISNLIISPTNRGSGCQRRKDLMTYTEGYGILAQLCPEGGEGALGATTATAEETTRSGSLPPLPAVRRIVNSFELIASQEAQVLIAAAARQQISSNQRDDAGEESSQLTSATTQYLDTTSAMMIISEKTRRN